MRLGLGLGFTAGTLNRNPILPLENIDSYIDFTDQSKYTLVGMTNEATSIAPTAGAIGFTSSGAEWDSSAGNGTGGVLFPDRDARIFNDTDYDADRIHTWAMVGSLPTFSSNSGDIIAYATSILGAANNLRVYHQAEGVVQLRRYENPTANINIINRASDGTFLIVFRSNSVSSADMFGDTFDNKNSGDPNDSNNLPRLLIGDRSGASSGTSNLQLFEFLRTSDALSDADIEAVIEYWREKYFF